MPALSFGLAGRQRTECHRTERLVPLPADGALFRAFLSVTAGTMDGMGPLTPKDHAILRFEESHWKFAGAKAAAITDRFGLNETAYYARLNRLIDMPEALAYAPLTVKRLQRLRAARREQRSGRRLDSR